MKLKTILAFLAIGMTASVSANITISLPETTDLKNIHYYYAPIKQYAEANSRNERGLLTDSVATIDSKAKISVPDDQAYLIGLNFGDNNIRLYTAPGDNVDVTIESLNPFEYSLDGSELAKGITTLEKSTSPLLKEYYETGDSDQPDVAKLRDIENRYNETVRNFIVENIENPAISVAIMNLEGEDFISIYENNKNAFDNNILSPIVKKQYETEKQGVEFEKKQQALQEGSEPAPNFTLKDLDGKEVSLSDFIGKWVILDFWGSWCPWCIKGFPELKEVFTKYSDKLVIIGIDCKESEKDWRAGVEKYQLPWVNLYNPDNSKVLKDYGVQGFPTKAIINPEGLIKNITVGHNPAFYTTLTSLMEE